MAVRFISRTADIGEFELEALFERFEYSHSFGNNFPADAIAGQHCDVHRRALARLREPGLLGQAFLLECGDLVFVPQRQFDIVEPV